ncbi:MAG: TetR/AcrR family transcriptional regulator [Pseudomonadota bacterium]
MRPSNRTKILDAAVRVIHRDGLIGVTFDSVAAEASVTRGGMMYHFPSREALVQAIHEHLAAQWEASLESVAGKPKSEATAKERAIAYARTSARSANRAELLSALQSGESTATAAAWDAVLDDWASPVPKNIDDKAALAPFIARLAADGLWVYESLTGKKLPDQIRDAIAEQIVSVIESASARVSNK